MPVASINSVVLNVGQGACNYIEVLDQNGRILNNLLIDCGTWTTTLDASIDGTLNALARRIATALRGRPGYPALDQVLISHGDTDHYRLIPEVFRRVRALEPTLPRGMDVGRVRWSGQQDEYTCESHFLLFPGSSRPINLISWFDEQGIPQSQLPRSSSYLRRNGNGPYQGPLWSNGLTGDDRVSLMLIINMMDQMVYPATSATAKPKERRLGKNERSAVLALVWRGTQVVFTADATAITMAWIARVMAPVAVADRPASTWMMTLPHHGSRYTTYNLRPNPIRFVDNFLRQFRPETISASANATQYHHASLFLIVHFLGFSPITSPLADPAASPGCHFYSCWIDMRINTGAPWPQEAQYGTLQTAAPIYTAKYFDAAWFNAMPPSNRFIYPNGGDPALRSAALAPQLARPEYLTWNFMLRAGPSGGVIKTVQQINLVATTAAARAQTDASIAGDLVEDPVLAPMPPGPSRPTAPQPVPMAADPLARLRVIA